MIRQKTENGLKNIATDKVKNKMQERIIFMDNKKSEYITGCLELYKKATELSKQEDDYLFIQACREFLDAVDRYVATYRIDIVEAFGNGKFFHDACKELINLKHYLYLYHDTDNEKEKDAYAEAYYAAYDRLDGYLKRIKEYLEKEEN